MKIINLFPLSLIKEKISLDIKNKIDMKNEILSIVKNSKNSELLENMLPPLKNWDKI